MKAVARWASSVFGLAIISIGLGVLGYENNAPGVAGAVIATIAACLTFACLLYLVWSPEPPQ